MLELPEVLTMAKLLNDTIIAKKVKKVFSPTKLHKFCWFNGDPENYNNLIENASISTVEGFGLHVEIGFDNGYKLCFNDGINLRFTNQKEEYQLKITFTDNTALYFNVAMYGGIILHNGDYDNEYYLKSKNYISPLTAEFEAYFYDVYFGAKKSLSAKAFLATEQRFPGIGNGAVQDILFYSGIHPKRKIQFITEKELSNLLFSIKSVLTDMITRGGRNTEKNVYGLEGGYKTALSKNSKICCKCGAEIIKENFLGGSIYYCPHCQPIDK